MKLDDEPRILHAKPVRAEDQSRERLTDHAGPLVAGRRIPERAALLALTLRLAPYIEPISAAIAAAPSAIDETRQRGRRVGSPPRVEIVERTKRRRERVEPRRAALPAPGVPIDPDPHPVAPLRAAHHVSLVRVEIGELLADTIAIDRFNVR